MLKKPESKLLKILYDSHINIFNTDDTPVSERLLIEASGFLKPTLYSHCDNLEKNHLIRKIKTGNNFYIITREGQKYIEEGGR